MNVNQSSKAYKHDVLKIIDKIKLDKKEAYWKR